MKRNLDLIRRMLLSIEEDDTINVECSDEEFAYHVLLLNEEDLVRGIVALEAMNGPPVVQQTMKYVRLTSNGHDFLDATRDESIWRRTQEKVKSVGGGAALNIVIAVATQFLREKMGLAP